MTAINFLFSFNYFLLQSYYNLYFFSHFNKTEPYPCGYKQGGGGGGGGGLGVNSDAQNYDRLESPSPDQKTDATVTAQNY